MATYSVQSGPATDPQSGSVSYSSEVTVAFASNRRKPPILLDTSGWFITIKRDTSIVNWLGTQKLKCNVTKSIVNDNPGSDSGLLNAALANLSGSSINALVAALELPETLKMLADIAQAIVRAARHFRKGNIMEGIKALGKESNLSRRQKARIKEADAKPLKNRTPEDLYLGWTFGLAPTMGDVQGAIQHLSKSFEEGKRMTSSRSSNGQSKNDRLRNRSWTGYGNGAPVGTVNPARAGYKVSVSGVIQNSDQVALNSLGLTNPIGAAWEIIPYSFVVDYFFNIGDYLGAIFGGVGFKHINGCKTTETVSRYHSRVDGTECISTHGVNRVPLVSGGWLLAQFPMATTAGVSSRQVANMGALIAQSTRAR